MGAVAVLAARPLPDALLPVVVVPDLQAALGRLAAAFYERPAARMRTVGVVGSFGKTTTAWLARGMFEETNERCGMIGEWLGVALWEKAGGERTFRASSAVQHLRCFQRQQHMHPGGAITECALLLICLQAPLSMLWLRTG